jgi:hypothetical protein
VRVGEPFGVFIPTFTLIHFNFPLPEAEPRVQRNSARTNQKRASVFLTNQNRPSAFLTNQKGVTPWFRSHFGKVGSKPLFDLREGRREADKN